MAIKEATKEVIYLSNTFNKFKELLNLKYLPNNIPIVFGDNQSSLKLSENPEFYKRTKHIDITYHFIREAIANNKLKVIYISSKEMLADSLTKPVIHNILTYYKDKLNLITI